VQNKNKMEETIAKELAPIRTQLSRAVEAASQITISNIEELTRATEMLAKVKTIGKQIAERKLSITAPLNEALKNARSLFAPIEAQWAEAERIIKDKMTAYQEKAIAQANARKAKIEQQVEAGKMSFDKAADKIEAITPPTTTTAKSGAVQFRTRKDVQIEDENKLPREYLLPDMVKIRKVALAGIEIPGVKVVEVQSVAGITK